MKTLQYGLLVFRQNDEVSVQSIQMYNHTGDI